MKVRSIAALGALVAAWGLACGGSTPAPPRPAATPSSSATPARIFAHEEAVAYTVKTSDGRVIGRTHGTYYDQRDGLANVRTRMALDPSAGGGAGGASARTVEVVTTLNADLTPLAYKELSSADGRLELRFKDRVATVLTDTSVRDVPYARSGAVLLPRHDLMTLALAFASAKLTVGSTAKLAYLSARAPSSTDELALRVYADADRRVVVQWGSGKATLDAEGRVVLLEDGETGWRFERALPPGDPPKMDPLPDSTKYARPATAEWTDREVVVEVRDGQLAGTLSEPRERGGAGRGLAPGVVFLSDLGAQDRSGLGAYDGGAWQLLDRLAEEGFAVLRLDDRGAGASTSKIPPEDAGLQLAVEDAAAAVAFLRSQPSVDPERVFVVGHGLGGQAAVVLAEQGGLSGVALVATPFRALPELMAANQAADTGADKDKLTKELRLAVAALEGNQAARAQVGPARLAELSTMRALFVEHGRLDLTKALARAKGELAVFQGMKDFQVSWREDAKPLVEALKKLGRKGAKLYVYENVDHLMKAEPQASSWRRYADQSRRVEGRFLDDLVGWLKGLPRAPGP